MGKFGTIDNLVRSTGANTLFNNITLGEVIRSDDPNQMGRLQVFVPAMDDDKTGDLPWAFYGSPFGGVTDGDKRGPTGDVTNGPISYGLWAIPKVGATVLIMCIDNNPTMRVWLGCVNGMGFPHTMPHGRHIDDDGPLSSTEEHIEPLYTKQTEAFTGPTGILPRESLEYLTRGSDRPVTAISDAAMSAYVEFSDKTDDTETQGYGEDQNAKRSTAHSNIYSITTPGFHAWSMDDNPESCRVRIRTTSGNQIIFDDTNERIYLSTAKGKTWIELDEAGTVDIYSEQDLSLRSQQDINITSDKTVRIAGKEGVHITSQGDVRTYAGGDLQTKADGDSRTDATNIFVTASSDYHLSADAAIRVKGATMFLESAGPISIMGASVEMASMLNVAGAVGITGVLSVAGLISSGSDVTTPLQSLNLHQHSYVMPKEPSPNQPGISLPSPVPTGIPAIATASPEPSESEPAETLTAFFPSRAPHHEPFARGYLNMDLTDNDELELSIFDTIINDPDSASEYVYTADEVGTGSSARGKTFTRNAKWQR